VADSRRRRRQVAVIGVGNVLARDEGIGPVVIARLRGLSLGSGVRLVDLGSDGLSLLNHLEEASGVVIVDCARMGLKPGSVRSFNPAQVRSFRDGAANFSLHSLDVVALLDLATKLFECPPVKIIGVEPEDVSSGEGLSQVLRRRIPRIVRTVLREAGKLRGECATKSFASQARVA
jgi:hydrogenase maturation protease